MSEWFAVKRTKGSSYQFYVPTPSIKNIETIEAIAPDAGNFEVINLIPVSAYSELKRELDERCERFMTREIEALNGKEKYRQRYHAERARAARLEEELQCLWSVLSEWDTDKTCYVQFVRANDLATARLAAYAAQRGDKK